MNPSRWPEGGAIDRVGRLVDTGEPGAPGLPHGHGRDLSHEAQDFSEQLLGGTEPTDSPGPHAGQEWSCPGPVPPREPADPRAGPLPPHETADSHTGSLPLRDEPADPRPGPRPRKMADARPGLLQRAAPDLRAGPWPPREPVDPHAGPLPPRESADPRAGPLPSREPADPRTDSLSRETPEVRSGPLLPHEPPDFPKGAGSSDTADLAGSVLLYANGDPMPTPDDAVPAHRLGSGDTEREARAPFVVPSGDRILGALFTAVPGSPADEAGTRPVGGRDRVERIGELAARLAQRILVSDRSQIGQSEVRIRLQESVLPGTEVRLRYDQGQLVVTFEVLDPEVVRQLAPQTDDLRQTLADKLGTSVRVAINETAPDAETDGRPGDGRSRNRRDPREFYESS